MGPLCLLHAPGENQRLPNLPVDLSPKPALPGTTPGMGCSHSLQPAPCGRRGARCFSKPPAVQFWGLLPSQHSSWSVSSLFRGGEETLRSPVFLHDICFPRLARSPQWHPVLWEVIFCWRAPQCLLLCLRLTFVPD